MSLSLYHQPAPKQQHEDLLLVLKAWPFILYVQLPLCLLVTPPRLCSSQFFSLCP